MTMSNFIDFISGDMILQFIGMIVGFLFTLFFFYNRFYKYALIFAILFFMGFSFMMKGPMGQYFIYNFKKILIG